MKRNRAVQLSLIATAIILFIFTYFYSADKDRVVDIDKNVSAESGNKLAEETSNITENVNYVGTSGGALFELNAAIAEIKYDEPNISHLQDVFVVIKIDGRTIHIQSDNALYDKTTNDSEFWSNVEVKEQDNIITCDNLNLFMSKNLITAYNNLNVKYNSIEGTGFLFADKVDLDILKNEANIIMFKKNDRVRVKYKN